MAWIRAKSCNMHRNSGVYGPRLTGSDMTGPKTAWAVDELKKMGLQILHTEAWGPFGRDRNSGI